MNGRVAGFTLLELLIAMGLLSLISVILYASLRTGTVAWQGGLERSQTAEEIRLAEAFMRRVMRQSMPIEVRKERARYAYFDGGSKAVQFAGRLPAQHGIGGVYELRLQAVARRGREKLEFTYRLLRPDSGPKPDWHEPAVLLGNVTGVTFSYFGAARANTAPQWQSKWLAADRLPSLVQVRYTDARGQPGRLIVSIEAPEPRNRSGMFDLDEEA
ncbi:MAG: prepilin-type N-terminal cleavage/methylation domain-containing protein [Chromatiales bacterium]